MDRTFNRNVCFQFYESYLEQAELIKEQFGAETCANYFIALTRYGLYQEEPSDKMVRLLISGLKNTIDAGQLKRERAFDRQNTDKTEMIIKYKQEHPEATQREIAEACDCSVGKVNKALNINSNNNYNNNINSNTNNNSVNMNVNTHSLQEEKKRELKDLTEEEAKEISEKLRNRERYVDIQNQYNLVYGSITKDFEKRYEEAVQREREQREQAKIDKNRDKYEFIHRCWGLESIKSTIRFVQNFLDKYGWTLDQLVDALKQNEDFHYNTYNKTIEYKEEWNYESNCKEAVPSITYPEWLNNKMCSFYGK